MLHQKQGNAPGIDTPIEKAAGVSQDSKGLVTDTIYKLNFRTYWARNQALKSRAQASELIANYGRIKSVMIGFHLDCRIDLDSIVMVILMAVFAALRGCHEL